MEAKSGFTFKRVREQMVEMLLEMGIKDFRVLDAMSQIARHQFLDEAFWSRAYENRSLTIGYKQTISQPYIVARMTELLIEKASGRGKIFKKIIDIGSGSGYQSAILSFFAEEVIGIERIKPLASKSRSTLLNLGIKNVSIINGDGYVLDGLKKVDGIICAAAPPEIPKDLIKLLKKDARLILPVGFKDMQKLICIEKQNKNSYEKFEVEDVAFVPMLGGISRNGD